MDIAIQHPWFRRALGSVYPARLFDQFFGEGIFDYDLFPYTASTISPYYRQSLFRNFLDYSNSGISEVTRSDSHHDCNIFNTLSSVILSNIFL